MGRSNAVGWYLGSVATFMIPAGIQMVLLPYLLAIELHQPATRLGITQMFGQLPMLVFLLFGGWLADKVDPRRLLIGLQAAAVLMPLILAYFLWRREITEALLMLYALAWGMVTAFAMPARDGMLRRVAGSNIQRMVTMALGIQFATQLLGQAIGGQTALFGATSLVLTQCLVLALGVIAASQLPSGTVVQAVKAPEAARNSLLHGLGGGMSLIFADAPMRAAFLIMLGVGVFFSGVLMVVVPLAVRDLFAGGAQAIAGGFMMFGIGTLVSIALLTKIGGLVYPGRALVLSMVSGCGALLPMVFAPPLWLFNMCIFFWGMSGGIAMSMSRTILQERAPGTHQSRVMAAHALSTAGGGPIGSLLMGFTVSIIGVRWSVLVPILGVGLTTMYVVSTHAIWRLRSRSLTA